MRARHAVRLGTNTSALSDVSPYPSEVFKGVDKHNQQYKLNDFVQHAQTSAKNNREYRARLLWTKLRAGDIHNGAVDAIRRDYKEEFEKFDKEMPPTQK